MIKRINAIITKTKLEQKEHLNLLKEAQSQLYILKHRMDKLSLKEAFIIGTRSKNSIHDASSGANLASSALYAEKKRTELKNIHKELLAIEKDACKITDRLTIIKSRLATKQRLIEHLSKTD